MFLFILKLFITAFLRSCSKFYMQGGLVSQALLQSYLAMGFHLTSYKFLFIHFHLSQSTDPENHVSTWFSGSENHVSTPAPPPWRHGTVSQSKRWKVPQHWHPVLTAISEDTSTLSNTDKIPQWYPNYEVPHISHPTPAPAFISVIDTRSRTLFLPNRLGQDANRRWKHNSHVTCSIYLLCFKQLHPYISGTPAPYYSEK